MYDNRPIGIFDSGVGGTSIWKEIIDLLPYENTLYLADSKYAPYGEKSSDEIIALSGKNTEFLLSKNCKLIVVACNTATTNAIDNLRNKYDLSFIGIEPAIKPAALASKNQTIGILATKGTLSSALFAKTASTHAQGIEIVEVIGTGLVELIESGQIYTEAMRRLLNRSLKPMLDKKIDHLVLGCSHYPYLIPILKELLPPEVSIIDSGQAVAKQTKNILHQKQLNAQESQTGKHRLYTNGSLEVLKNLIPESDTIKVSSLNF